MSVSKAIKFLRVSYWPEIEPNNMRRESQSHEHNYVNK